MFAAVCQLGINFIGNHRDARLLNQRHNFTEIFPGHNSPGKFIKIAFVFGDNAF